MERIMSLIKKYFLYSLHDCCYSGCLFCFHFQVVRVGQDSCLPPVLLPPLLFHFFFLFYRRGKKKQPWQRSLPEILTKLLLDVQ